jgi:hypothetical protein
MINECGTAGGVRTDRGKHVLGEYLPQSSVVYLNKSHDPTWDRTRSVVGSRRYLSELWRNPVLHLSHVDDGQTIIVLNTEFLLDDK